MTINVKRAVRILRYRGYKITTAKGRITAIDGLRTSKTRGITSRKLESIALRMSEAPKESLPSKRAGFRRAKTTQRRYNYRARKMKLPNLTELTNRMLERRLGRGETEEQIRESAVRNLHHYADIAYKAGVDHLVDDLGRANIMPRTRQYLIDNPEMTDTHLAELQQIKYNENYTLEQKDEIGLSIAQEGHRLALQRLKEMGGMP